MKLEAIELISKQPHLDAIDFQEIESKLASGKIVKTLHQFTNGRNKEIYLVQLDNGLLAVFKERKNARNKQKDIIAAALAFELFKLQHTIPPVVEKTYGFKSGILQYYVPATIELTEEEYDFNHKLKHIISNIDHNSYADLQTFKYVACLQDINIDGLRVWQSTDGKFCLTYIDTEELYPTSDAYGQTMLGKADITHYSFIHPKDAFNSKYTSFFNEKTIAALRTVTEDSLIALYQNFCYEIDDEAKAYIKRFLSNCASIITIYEQKSTQETSPHVNQTSTLKLMPN